MIVGHIGLRKAWMIAMCLEAARRGLWTPHEGRSSFTSPEKRGRIRRVCTCEIFKLLQTIRRVKRKIEVLPAAARGRLLDRNRGDSRLTNVKTRRKNVTSRRLIADSQKNDRWDEIISQREEAVGAGWIVKMSRDKRRSRKMKEIESVPRWFLRSPPQHSAA